MKGLFESVTEWLLLAALGQLLSQAYKIFPSSIN